MFSTFDRFIGLSITAVMLYIVLTNGAQASQIISSFARGYSELVRALQGR
jgi:hypothetical protein